MEISIGKPSEAMPEQIASRSTPISKRAARVMSPLIPLKQSKWATRTLNHSQVLILRGGKYYGAGF